MSKKILKTAFFIFSLVFLYYLSLPAVGFPPPPPDSLQSQEPADTESPLRRAYFTDLSREEVTTYYRQNFKLNFFSAIIPNYRLNYPPEEAQTIIREQTRSTFLEEIVYPFRESLFVNGFKPSQEKDIIFISGRKWEQKIIVRYVPSLLWMRILVGIFILISMALIFVGWKNSILKIGKVSRTLIKNYQNK